MTQTQMLTHATVETESLLDVVLRATEQVAPSLALSAAPVNMPYDWTRARLDLEHEALRRFGQRGRVLQEKAREIVEQYNMLGFVEEPVYLIVCPICHDPACCYSRAETWTK